MKTEPYMIYESQIERLIRADERLVYLRVGELIAPDEKLGNARAKVRISDDTVVEYASSTYQLLKYLSGPRSLGAIQKYMEYFSIPQEFLNTLMGDHVVIRVITRSHVTVMRSFRGLRVIPTQTRPENFMLEDDLVQLSNGYYVPMILAQILYGKDDAVGTKRNSDLPHLVKILCKQSKISRKKAIETIAGAVTKESVTYRCPRGPIKTPFLGLENLISEVTLRWFPQRFTEMLYNGDAILEWVKIPVKR